MKRTTCAVLALIMLAGCATKPQPKPQPKDINYEGELWFCEQLVGKPCEEK